MPLENNENSFVCFLLKIDYVIYLNVKVIIFVWFSVKSRCFNMKNVKKKIFGGVKYAIFKDISFDNSSIFFISKIIWHKSVVENLYKG